MLPTAQQGYLEQARDSIVSAIAAVGENKSPTAYLPRKALAYFDRLGRSLLDDEAIAFPTGDPDAPARLTKETRLRLLKAAEVTERTEEIHIRGGIFDFNQEDLFFVMMLPDGSKVTGPVGTRALRDVSRCLVWVSPRREGPARWRREIQPVGSPAEDRIGGARHPA